MKSRETEEYKEIQPTSAYPEKNYERNNIYEKENKDDTIGTVHAFCFKVIAKEVKN